MMDETILRNVVASAARNLHTLSITYISQTGAKRGLISYREVEPYSYRDLPKVGAVLYAWDISPDQVNSTKSFALIGIEHLQELINTYVPRFRVEVAEFDRLFNYFIQASAETSDGTIVIAPNPKYAQTFFEQVYAHTPALVTQLGEVTPSVSGESYAPVGAPVSPPGRILNIQKSPYY